MRWNCGRRGGEGRRGRDGSSRGQIGPRTLRKECLVSESCVCAVWSRMVMFGIRLKPTAVPPRSVEAAVGKVGEFSEDIEDGLPDEIPHKLRRRVRLNYLLVVRQSRCLLTRYSTIKGKMRSISSHGNSLALPESDTPVSFICTVFITTGSATESGQICMRERLWLLSSRGLSALPTARERYRLGAAHRWNTEKPGS